MLMKQKLVLLQSSNFWKFQKYSRALAFTKKDHQQQGLLAIFICIFFFNIIPTHSIMSDQPAPVKGVLLETNMGAIVIELYWDHTPKTCKNFYELAKKGYYNGVLFHRIVRVCNYNPINCWRWISSRTFIHFLYWNTLSNVIVILWTYSYIIINN